MFFDNREFIFLQWLKEERQRAGRGNKPFTGERRYRHFDGYAQLRMVESGEDIIASTLRDSDAVASYRFYPFLRSDQRRRRFVGNSVKGKKSQVIEQKIRPIMYASHHDSLVYSFYAFILRQAYEERIRGSSLQESVIAYRRIPREDNPRRGKSNIDFALEIHNLVKSLPTCTIICLDIKGFFDNIDHSFLKSRWSILLGVRDLPNDHYHIFRSITKYRYAFLNDVLGALNLGRMRNGKFRYHTGVERRGRLCTPQQYRTRARPLEHSNKSTVGIPQGSPISDILANLYLECFDRKLVERLDLLEFGWYRRYSDDILIVCPAERAKEIYDNILVDIGLERLRLSIKKTEAVLIDSVKKTVQDITYELTKEDIHKGRRREVFQYLGFEMDASGMHVRSGTVAGHYRRAKRRAKAQARALASLRGNGTEGALKRSSSNRSRMQYFINVERRTGSVRVRKQKQKIIRRVRGFIAKS